MKVFPRRFHYTEFCWLEYDVGYTRTQNNTDDSLRWDKQQSFENNYLRQTTAQSISETVLT